MFLISATTGVEKGIQFLANLGSFATIVLFLFFLFFGGATVLAVSQGIETIGNYIIQVLPDVVADRRRRRGVDGGLDHLLLGLVDLLGALRRHVRGPDLPRPHDPGVRARRGRGAHRLRLLLVRRSSAEPGSSCSAPARPTCSPSVATPELSLFTALDALPLPTITSAVCIFLIALFFVSGADAASIVMATMATRGSLQPPRIVVSGARRADGRHRLRDAAGRRASALQQAAVLGSVPFTFVIVGVAWCWIKALREETGTGRCRRGARRRPAAAGRARLRRRGDAQCGQGGPR